MRKQRFSMVQWHGVTSALRRMQAPGCFTYLGRAYDRHMEGPRDVKAMVASRTLGEWDPTFVAAVGRDGVLLRARGPLPAPLAVVA
jgi:hypothetical protein